MTEPDAPIVFWVGVAQTYDHSHTEHFRDKEGALRWLGRMYAAELRERAETIRRIELDHADNPERMERDKLRVPSLCEIHETSLGWHEFNGGDRYFIREVTV